MHELTTPRLILEPAAEADHASLHALFTQPGVRRFLFDDHEITPEQTSEFIQKSEALFRTSCYGMWLARLRPAGDGTAESDGLVGFGAFWFFRDPPELELLYGVADDHTKQGYGREIARAVIDYGFRNLNVDIIRASTDAIHTDSRRLLTDLGFTLDREANVGGIDTAFYYLHRNDRP